ncbi:MAG: glycoside hydrolase family 5 protein [Oscillospiraceae bacterium]|nr:glycoside hydrolase family 5 protein [Oscillospiraceae bacterium]
MKKIISAISAAALMLSISACEKKAEDTRPLGEMRNISSVELVAEMGAGWNLGNTMDAEGGETAWGNPVTTKEMIDEIYKAGFNTIRIPTTWDGHMGEAPDFAVDEEWINRVEEVVGYALENDMYVILNTHHETKWIKPKYDGLDDVKVQLAALWTQIAEHFKDYGDHLVFEGLNEPRIVGGANEWNGGTEEGRDCLNQLNTVFVETVRKTGGNNDTRTLLITTFAAQSVPVAINDLTIPDDGHIGVSIHAYTPYRFTYDSVGEVWNTAVFDDSCAWEIDNLFDSLNNTFVSKGIPVIITEYGSVSKMIDKDWYISNTDEVAKWASHYIGTAEKYGVPCVWWDNGYHDSGNELFGIFNRRELTWYEPKIVEAIINSLTE